MLQTEFKAKYSTLYSAAESDGDWKVSATSENPWVGGRGRFPETERVEEKVNDLCPSLAPGSISPDP